MEEIWYNPIELLKTGVHSGLDHLISALSSKLQKEISDANILFAYDNRLLAIKTPKAEIGANRIILQDTHMAFLWCCSYMTVAFNTIYYQQIMGNDGIADLNDAPGFAKGKLTLNWARLLRHKISPWPMAAGRPDVPDRWTEPATNLYQACVCYLMFHEICHVIKHQHLLDLLKRRLYPYYELTEPEQKQIYDAEVEADQFAMDCLIGNSTDNDIIMVKCLGAVLAQLSNFYLLDTPDTRGGNHPDLDVRLSTIVKQVDLKTEGNKIQFDAHVSNGLQLFFKLTDKDFIPEGYNRDTFKNFETLHAYLFELIDQMKKASR